MKSKQVSEFKETEVGKIPVDWEIKKLGEVTLLITDGKHGDCENQENSGYYFLSAKDVIDGKLQYSSARQITKNDFDEVNKRTSLEIGDVLITNSGTIGRLAIAQHPEKTKKTTFQKSVAIIKTKKTELNNLFLYYFLLFSKKILSETIAGGTSQPNLLLGDLRSFLIQLPPLEYQIQISKNLSTLDSKIQNLQNQNKVLEQIAQAIFQSWFVDFDGVTEFEDSELGKIPKGWKVESIDHVSELFDSQRKPLSGIIRSKKQGKFPYYGASGIIDYIDDYIFDGNYLLIAEDGENLRSRNNPIAFFASGKFWVNNHAHIIKPKNNFSMIFLWIFFKKLDLSPWITGAAQPKLNQENLMSIPIIVPPSNQLLEFNSISQTVFKLLQHTNMELKILTKTRDALLPKLMSGEIRV